MTKSTWAIIIIVVLLLAAGAAVAYREPLSRLFSRPQAQTPVLESPGTGVQTQQYSTTTFSLQYPPDYALNEAYAYDQFGPKKLIHGISLVIPAAMATGTTLSPPRAARPRATGTKNRCMHWRPAARAPPCATISTRPTLAPIPQAQCASLTASRSSTRSTRS